MYIYYKICLYQLWVSIFADLNFAKNIFCIKDYVNFSLARHAFSLKRLVEAKLAFEKLFVHKSTQLTIQQETNIKEYIFIHKVSQYSLCI